MSYEGYREYLCTVGHHSSCDAYDDLTECPRCGGRLAFCHSVDLTNGVEEDAPYTMPAPKNEIGFDEVEMHDHRGNRYYKKTRRYEPVSEWLPIGV